MTRKRPDMPLTGAEYRIMRVVWNLGAVTVNQVLEALKDSALAYTTVLTTFQVLERKGYVRHRESGRAYVYEPTVTRDSARRKVVRSTVLKFFENSPSLLALNILENEQLNDEDLATLESALRRRTKAK
jgi:predicted transcriptional regulator